MKNSSDKKTQASAVDDCAQAVQESWQKKTAALQPSPAPKSLMLTAERELRETVYGSDAYKTTLELRHRVLREPLGLNLWHENLSVEVNQRHFSLWQSAEPGRQAGDILLACVVITPLAKGCVKLRQMAVNPDYQRQGLGQLLITKVEKILLADGIGLIELHARVSAEAFYKNCGYTPVGEIFTEVGIAHRCMTKIINPVIADQ